MTGKTKAPISGKATTTIPAGTEFEILIRHSDWSKCGEGIPLTMIYNDEYEIVDDSPPSQQHVVK